MIAIRVIGGISFYDRHGAAGETPTHHNDIIHSNLANISHTTLSPQFFFLIRKTFICFGNDKI